MRSTPDADRQGRLIPADATGRLAKLILMLGSDQDGEVLGAAAAIKRTLAGVDRDLHDLADAITIRRNDAAWARETARWCLDVGDELLSEKEAAFLAQMLRSHFDPSVRQAAWLRSISDRLREVTT